jgi:hypothetical protein
MLCVRQAAEDFHNCIWEFCAKVGTLLSCKGRLNMAESEFKNDFFIRWSEEGEHDKAKAKEYAETALKLATCDGPPYYYKVAYEEAERMLENLK